MIFSSSSFICCSLVRPPLAAGPRDVKPPDAAVQHERAFSPAGGRENRLSQRRAERSMLVKKYTNRRLYDTEDSRYITLEELAERIRAGRDAQVIDARTGEDLTQVTLAQIIMESRGAGRILPVPLLLQLIRLGDEPLAEFLGMYMSQALESYLEMKRGAESALPFNPFANVPFAATSALARIMMSGLAAVRRQAPAPVESEVVSLRRELDELKREVHRKRK
jgi:polyhydroxyalkanoate synthesis repressor PhaR